MAMLGENKTDEELQSLSFVVFFFPFESASNDGSIAGLVGPLLDLGSSLAPERLVWESQDQLQSPHFRSRAPFCKPSPSEPHCIQSQDAPSTEVFPSMRCDQCRSDFSG